MILALASGPMLKRHPCSDKRFRPADTGIVFTITILWPRRLRASRCADLRYMPH